MSGNLSISIVIPVFNEKETINNLLRHLFELNNGSIKEILIIDGDEKKSTINNIDSGFQKKSGQLKLILLASCKGRALQMNKGASVAKGEWILFLHADTYLPENGIQKIQGVAQEGKYDAGAFRLGIDSTRTIIKLIEIMANFRTFVTGIPYGDQALFMKKKFFLELGGFPGLPIMEDIELMRRIKRRKNLFILLNEKVNTSPRRWEKEGAVFATLRNWSLAILYLLGVPAEKLALFYRDK